MKKIIFILLIALVGCKVAEKQIRSFGLVEDDPAKVSKIPLIMSQEIRVAGLPQVESMARGKPVKGDVTPPSVSITSPANGAAVSGTVVVNISASDNVGVVSVSLFYNGNIYSTISTPPYNFSWNTATVGDGTHTLKGTATDAKGNIGSATITVSKNTVIYPPPPPPTPSVFPSRIELNTPVPGNQGNEWCCVAFSTVRSARSIDYFYKTGATTYSDTGNIFSVEYIYNQVKAISCAGGTGITTCLDFMQIKGVIKEAMLPYNDMNGCDIVPTQEQITEALKYRIGSYSKIVHTDTVAMKTMLYYKHPLIIGIDIDNCFVAAGPGFIWNATTKCDGHAGHGVTIVGYDDAKHAWKIMNSWGTGWGDGGYSWIDYDLFPLVAGYYLYVIN